MNVFVNAELTAPYRIHQRVVQPYAALDYNNFEPTLSQLLKQESQIWQEEFIYCFYEPCIIEPKYGWGLNEKFQLISESHPFGRFVKPEFLPQLDAATFDSAKKIYLDQAVLLWENGTNYFHFWNDVIGRLALLDRCGVSKSIPVILPSEFASNAFFNQFRQEAPDFFNRLWLFQQPDEYYVVNKGTYFTQIIGGQHQNFEPVLTKLQQAGSGSSPKRIFITRSVEAGRTATNLDAIERLVGQHGFEIIDNSLLNLSQQRKVFSAAEMVIGFHGAGLTNMLFCPAGTSILELFPGNFYKGIYYWLSSQFGHRYHAVLGDAIPQATLQVSATTIRLDGNFFLPLGKVERKIEQMLYHRSGKN